MNAFQTLMWEGPSSGGCYKYITAPHWLACVEGAPLWEECFCLDWEMRAAFQSFLVLRTQEVRVCSGFAFNHMATFRSMHLQLRRRYTLLHRYTVSKTLIILLKITKQGQADALTEIQKLCHKPLYYTHITANLLFTKMIPNWIGPYRSL